MIQKLQEYTNNYFINYNFAWDISHLPPHIFHSHNIEKQVLIYIWSCLTFVHRLGPKMQAFPQWSYPGRWRSPRANLHQQHLLDHRQRMICPIFLCKVLAALLQFLIFLNRIYIFYENFYYKHCFQITRCVYTLSDIVN